MLYHIFKRFNVTSAAGTLLAGALLALALLLAPHAALATVATPQGLTTNHWKQGSSEGYSITATVTVPDTLAGLPDMTLSGAQVSSPVALVPDTAGTTYSVTVPVATRPQVGDAYSVDVVYPADPTNPIAPETLQLNVSAVLDSFAAPVSPLGGVGGTTNPTFNWTAPQSGSVAAYRLAIYGVNELNGDAWLSPQIPSGTLSGQYLPTAADTSVTGGYPTSLVAGTLYNWSVFVFDANGNSTEIKDGTVMIGANLSGKVTDFSGAAIADATVQVRTSTGGYVAATTTGTDGSYLIGGLTTNTVGYKVIFTKLIDGVQQTTYYNNRLDDSDLLPVNSGVLQTGINAVLGGWGAITGKVVNSSSSPMSGVTIQLLDANGNATSYPTATTKSDGTFSFNLLPPATYKVKAIGAAGVYADTLYSDSLTVTAGQVNSLPSNIMLYRINISGTVTDQNGAPVAGIGVYLLTTSGSYVSNYYGTQTASNGTYAIAGITVGSYKVFFDTAGTSYAKQYYNQKATVATADTVTVLSATTPVTGKNAVLGSGKPTVTAFTVPSTSTSLTVSGITFTASEPTFGTIAGYMITESATQPSDTDTRWKTTAPTSYTVSGVGDITLYAWAKGATGVVSDSVARSVTVTYVAPTVTLSTLSDQAVTANQVLNVAGSAATGVTTLTVNGQTANLAADGSFSFPIKLVAGANTVEVVANGTTTFTRSITYDATAPALSVTQPADNQVTTTASTTVSGTVVAGATVSVSVNGGAPVQAIVSGTDWIANVTIVAGVNTIEVVADLSGKKNYGKRTISLVSTLPDLVVTGPVQDVVIDKSTQTITGTVSSGATVSVSAGGKTFTPQVTSGSFSQDVSFAARGSYPVTVTATSTAGTSTVVRNLIVERRIGDCNNSGGAITSADLQYAINIVIGKPGFDYSTFCDVNFNVANGTLVPDGQTSSADVQTLINVLITKAGWVLP
ncbi:MSCRAMM family protein [Geomonas edaphica]|uniref:MSCRAMM family protein n=1 Tax=Geomonas edaphica TaxID=2570226 RepID=UPI0013A5CBCA|nr:carboxypeptidase regulatory-like domain-containing protein [Geomonas edaphica]